MILFAILYYILVVIERWSWIIYMANYYHEKQLEILDG
jgi:hypothetical protein